MNTLKLLAMLAGTMLLSGASCNKETVSIVFHADHPFLYLITETTTGVTLFAGRYSAK